jgi:gliding motility-associated-like protein
MKKIISLFIILFICSYSFAQVQVNIGPQSSTFSSWVRGYHFTSPTNFTICALYIPTDASTGSQNISVVRFTGGAPPAFPGTTNAFVNLFSILNFVPNTTVACNVVVNAGDIIGVYGARSAGCVNSYDGANFATTINGLPTNLLRSGMQQCLAATPMANIWSEVGFSVGRIFMYYNCCPTPTVTTAASTQSVCFGGTSTLTAGGAATYTWNPGGVVSTTVAVSPTVNTTYTVTGTQAGCQGSNTVNIGVNPTPTITVNTNTATLCAGNIASLTLGGAVTYTLNPGNLTGTSFTVSPPSTTIYTITGISTAGCIGTRTVAINVNANPTITLSSNAPVCTGSALTLSVNPLTTYAWTGPNAFSSVLQNPTIVNSSTLNSGTYSLTVLNAVGCSASGTIAVTVNPRPTIQASSNSPVCVGKPINFSGLGGTSASWTGPSAFASASYSPVITSAAITNAGNYSLTITDANGCANTTVTAVVVNALPVIVVNNPTACVNSALSFSASGGVSYSWQGPIGFNSAVQNPNLTNVQVTNSGQYTVTVTSAAGCTNTAVSNATVHALPIATANNSSPICANATLSLTASGGVNYGWVGPNGFTSLIQNPTLANAQPNVSGTYTVLITNAQTCTNTAVTNVTVNALPTPSITSNSPICEGQNLTATASGGSNYVWSGPNGFISNAASIFIGNALPIATGLYSLVVTDANNCTQSTTSVLTVNALPIVSVSGGAVCVNQNLVLTASGGASYAWTGPNGFTSVLQNPTLVNASTNMAGNYTVVVTNANGCTKLVSAFVLINPAPTATITSNSPICESKKLELFAGGSLSYSWQGPNGFNSNSQNPVIASASYLESGIYSVKVIDAIGCYTTVSIPVTVYQNPQVNISPSIKGGCEPQCLSFVAQTNATGTNVVYVWDLGNGNATGGANVSTCYNTAKEYKPSLQITDGNGCVNSNTTSILIYPKPNADFNFSPLKPTLYDNTVEFKDGTTKANITQWSWYFNSTAVIGSTSQNPSHKFEEIGNYLVSLIVTSDFGCTDTISKQIIVDDEYAIYIPNAFTPNGDGINDTFQPKGSGFTKYNLNIFDRWGTRIFQSNEVTNAWDGFLKGTLCEDGVYTYKITLLTISGKAKDLTGTVTLLK